MEIKEVYPKFNNKVIKHKSKLPGFDTTVIEFSTNVRKLHTDNLYYLIPVVVKREYKSFVLEDFSNSLLEQFLKTVYNVIMFSKINLNITNPLDTTGNPCLYKLDTDQTPEHERLGIYTIKQNKL